MAMISECAVEVLRRGFKRDRPDSHRAAGVAGEGGNLVAGPSL
jgi:hypothetical protein